MRSVGIVLAVVGIVVLAAGIVNHFVKNFMGSSSHASLIIGAIGGVLLVIGVVMSMMSSGAKAA
ncbi:MAG: hypothetical protein C5B60_02190 [Chloroflexi bacterium]|nr:MAG: hypothetical protein C5B60_02190 [Chloroflexota bacterium]